MPTPDEKQIQFAAELRKLADAVERGGITIVTLSSSMTNPAEIHGLPQIDGMANRISKFELTFYRTDEVT